MESYLSEDRMSTAAWITRGVPRLLCLHSIQIGTHDYSTPIIPWRQYVHLFFISSCYEKI